MKKNEGLTPRQEATLMRAMNDEGISLLEAEAILASVREDLGEPPEPNSVSVTQTASVVEAGATVIGYRARNI